MPKRLDITGQRFGSLTVIRRRPDVIKDKRAQWECLCDCGGVIFTSPDPLKRRLITSCGHCFVNENIGKKFGRLTIMKFSRNIRGLSHVLCICECGNEKEVATAYVVRGSVKSCGCLRKDVNLKKSEKKIGAKFHLLKVLKIYGKDENGNILLLCKCKCGNKKVIQTGDFNLIKSCGCLQRRSIPKGENHQKAKLKNCEAQSIRDLYKSKSGYTKKELAKMFGLTMDTLRRVLRNQTYRDAQPEE